VQNLAPGLTGYLKEVTGAFRKATQEDPRFSNGRDQVDDTDLKTRLPPTPRTPPTRVDGDSVSVDAVMEKIEADYRARFGELVLSNNTTVPDSLKVFQIPESQKADFEKRMKAVRKGLEGQLKAGVLPPSLTGDALRGFVGRVSQTAHDGEPGKLSDKVGRSTEAFGRDMKVAFVHDQIKAGQPVDDLAMAEAIVLQAEGRAWAQLGGDIDLSQGPEVSEKKHKALVGSLATALSKVPVEKRGDPKLLMAQLTSTLLGSEAFQKKGGSIFRKPDPNQITIDPKKASKAWVERLRSL